MKVRENIEDYIVEINDKYVLLKEPLCWEDGEVSRKVTTELNGIDIKAVMQLLVGNTDEIVTFGDMYKVCETLLQMHEDGQEVFPK